ncbi:electron transfer flavoprotein subunit alpha/FixB family protein [Arachidicoccus terrestris]|uniref:electron transfer flavoprotein subunit alpha/FixB family protein n=1 Tax=Arachidicoccus terrestris TaxID=2875539 RepID=UPI001CC829E3|nr:electron transfer flavoprotein subunit alpha/FixB family protein [Arachidicoccus terrestris]UAY54100.1 electron transfer flavoprotein subunit alpha/FixB family protein [Arachidicoccus terrestris]
MSVLIYIDHADGQIKKSALEAISYGAALANKLNTTAEGLVLGHVNEDLSALGAYGVSTVHQAADEAFDKADSQALSQVIASAAAQSGAEVLIFAANANGVALAPRTAVRLKAGLVSFAVALPELENGFTVKKVVFSGKAFAHVKINTPVKVITLTGNSYPVEKTEGTATITTLDLHPAASKVTITGVQKVEGEVPLTEAEIVVSGGRGLKGPENWHLVTDLAHALHGAIACSRPVADDGWRPHHEHVGQTGIQIAPNLYIAIGISGAIQHLGGVNRSKTIVVVNKDPEAPFFKAADYGIVGDAFEVIPRLTEAVKALKS